MINKKGKYICKSCGFYKWASLTAYTLDYDNLKICYPCFQRISKEKKDAERLGLGSAKIMNLMEKTMSSIKNKTLRQLRAIAARDAKSE